MTTMYRWLTPLLWLFICSTVATNVRAEPAESSRQQARRAFERGMELVNQERWAEALTRFDESLRIYPNHTALFNRGLCLSLLGRPREAFEALEEHLRQYGSVVDAETRDAVEEEFERVRRRVGRIDIQVEGAPTAAVQLDGVAVGSTPLARPLVVDPGRHQVTVEAPDVSAVSRWVTVGSGDEVTVVIALGGAIATDSEDLENGSEPGPSDQASSSEQQAVDAQQETSEPRSPPSSQTRGLRIGAYTATGVAVASLGAALGLFLWNNSLTAEWEREDASLREAMASTQASDQTALDTRITDNDLEHEKIQNVSIASWVTLALGSVATVAAVALYVLGFRRPERQVSLVASPGWLALTASW